MALRAKVRGQWRVVSKAMARRFRVRGLEVVDDAATVTVTPVAPEIVNEVTVVYPGTADANVAAELAKREAEAREQREDERDVVTEREMRAIEIVKESGDPDLAVLAGGEIVSVTELVESASQGQGPRTYTIDFPNGSNVRIAKLDIDRGIVTVTFKNGATASYGSFTEEMLKQWEAAPSAGQWFHHNVRSKPDRHPLLNEARG